MFTNNPKISFHFILFIFVLLSSFNLNAQVPTIKWWYNTNDFSAGQSTAADIDNDGKKEIVFGCYRNDSSVYALNAEDGTLLWQNFTSVPNGHGCNDVAPIIYDVDYNGTNEVIVPSSCNPKTFCYNGIDGTIKWVANTRGSDSPPTIADLDNDGKPEIIHGEFGGYVICLNAYDGTVKWEILVDSNSWIQTAPTVLDLDGDGQLDFVVATWNFNNNDSIFAFRGDNQTRLWAYPIQDHMYHGFAVADLDLDGKPELLVGSYNDTLYCINGENGTLKWKYKGEGYVGAPVSIGDIDNDGVCDVVFVGGSIVTALDNNGVLKWNYSIPNFGQAFRGVVLADISNDAYLDVIFGTTKGELIALNGNNGSAIFNLNLAVHYGNPLYSLSHAPLVSDFDNDGKLDIFIVGGYGVYPNISNNFGRAYMITVGAGNGPDWLMFQRDIRRQSSLCPFISTDIDEQLSISENNVQLFPNPASNVLNFNFKTIDDNRKTIIIFNALGSIVYKKENLISSVLTLDITKWGNGIYYFQLQSIKGNTEQGKFIISK